MVDMKACFLTLIFFCGLGALFPVASLNATEGSDATVTASVQPNGLRPLPDGIRFFNVRGVGSSRQFASYGVLEFDLFRAGGSTFDAQTEVVLILSQRNANFTAPGRFSVFLAGNRFGDLVPGSENFIFDRQAVPHGMDPETKAEYPLWKVGEGSFEVRETGEVDTYILKVADWPRPAQEFFASAFRQRGTVRLFLFPEDESIAATWSGIENSRATQPPRLLIRQR
jgi:hypothetical protein